VSDQLVDMDQAARAFYELSKRLKQAEKGRRSAFHKAVREAAKPLLPAVRRQAESRFPSRGGLNRHMARGTRYRAVAKTGITTAGVSIRANKTDPRADTQGRITHPIPDGHGDWLRHPPGTKRAGQRIIVVQMVPNAVGFFRDTIEERAELVRDDMVQRMTRWAVDELSGTIHG
jgi:hypothetical protein